MAATTETGTPGTNGTTPTAKEDSLLTTLHKDWLKRTGGKMPDKKTIDAVKKKLQAAVDKESAALKTQEEARAEFDAASDEALKLLGKKNISLEGNVLLTPSSRGDRVYYKKMTHEDAV